MAAVRMLVKLSGSRDGVEWPAVGEVLVCPDEEAASLIGTCLAVADAKADAGDVVEVTATPEAPENAAVKRGPGRPRKEG